MSTATGIVSAATDTTSYLSLFDSKKPKTPVYFFSHGGPTFMYPEAKFGGDIGAYNTVKSLGKFIQDSIKPNFIIVVSAHWQSNSNNRIEIGIPGNTLPANNLKHPDELELIYDFGGFPQYMYEEQFHSRGSLELANDIKETLNSNNLDSKLTSKGIDHGVWVPFKVAFSSNNPKDKEWDLDVPLIQVSLTASDDFEIHHSLGKSLAKYRELGGVIICSGMSVHNLRDLGIAMGQSKPLSYVEPFNAKLKDIVTGSIQNERLDNFNGLLQNDRQLLYNAHPSLEHLMPIVVASGAANGEYGKEVYNNASLSLGWGVYQFGEY